MNPPESEKDGEYGGRIGWQNIRWKVAVYIDVLCCIVIYRLLTGLMMCCNL
jgi:hypothetical protein